MRPDGKQNCASKHMDWNRRRATQHCKTIGIREHTEPYHHWNQFYKNTKGQQKRARVTALMGARLWTKQNQQPIGKQPIDQSIDRSVDQSINQINQSINRLMNQSQFKSMEPEINHISKHSYRKQLGKQNKTTRDHIVNSLITCKRKVNNKANKTTQKQKQTKP